MTKHMQAAPEGRHGWRPGRWEPASRRETRRAGREEAEAGAEKIKITWHGERITRMVFPSGTTVEFL